MIHISHACKLENVSHSCNHQQQRGRASQGVDLTWDHQWYLNSTKRKLLWHLDQQILNTLQPILLVVSSFDFASYLLDCLIRSWNPQLFIVIIKVVSNSIWIQSFMTGPSTKIKYHFIRDNIRKGAMKLQCIPTDQWVVDILTKPLEKSKFEAFKNIFGLV